MTDNSQPPDPPRLQEQLASDRHRIIQIILGHPKHLASLDELTYMTGLPADDVNNCLDKLRNDGIIDTYPALAPHGGPSEFYGLTNHGVRAIDSRNYLSATPVWRALYSRTKKTDTIRAHESAPRPELPDTVAAALMTENP